MPTQWLSRAIRTAVLAVCLFAASVPGPDAAAGPARVHTMPGEGHTQHGQQLSGVRERLARRLALKRALDQQVEQLDAAIGRLQAQRDGSGQVLADAQDQVQALERELDRLVPRLVARIHALRERRELAAQALAGLVGLTHGLDLEPARRAQLLAVSPLMLQRLRTAETSVAALRAAGEQAMARHRQLREEVPSLRAAHQQLEASRQEARRRQQEVTQRRAVLADELAALREQETTLARAVVLAAGERSARSAPRADQPALRFARLEPDRVAGRRWVGLRQVALKGAMAHPPAPAGERSAAQAMLADARLRAGKRPESSINLGLQGQPHQIGLHLAQVAARPGKGRIAQLNDLASWSQVAALESAAVPLVDAAAQPVLALPARLEGSVAPVIPFPGEVIERFDEPRADGLRPGITIKAPPGQAVAAPVAGTVAFADRFRSYGLLLIIEHGRGYHTLLWGFDRLDVQRGDQVHAGQLVGAMGAGGDRNSDLHVELRRNGRPVNPLPWLAANSSKVRG